MTRFSTRIQAIEESGTIKVDMAAKRLRLEGRAIYNFSVGELDGDVDTQIIAATKQALEKGQTRYSAVAGLEQLREGLAQTLPASWKYGARNILVSNGSKQILFELFQALCDPGDEIILPLPAWPSFIQQIALAGAKPVFVPLSNGDLDLQAIEQALSPQTRAIIINAPHNPTGTTFSEKSVRALCELALQHNFLVVSDEAYISLTYDDIQPVVPADLRDSYRQCVVTVRSFSKSHAMAGFRLGYLAAEPELIAALAKMQGHVSGNPCTFAQFGALAALKESERIGKALLAELQHRRDLAHSLLTRIMPCPKPKGGFYLYPKVSQFLTPQIPTSEDLALFLLEKAGVATVPGEVFGTPGYLRLSFSSGTRVIDEGFAAMEKVLCA